MDAIIQKIKDIFISGVFLDELIDRDNGGVMCNEYMSLEFKLAITFFTIPIYIILFFYYYLGKLKKEFSEDSNKPKKPFLIEKILGYLSIAVFFVHCIYKSNASRLLLIMNPCHFITLIEAYLLINSSGTREKTIYTVLMNTLFSPWIAIVFAVTVGLNGPYEVHFFWLEHILCGIINPLVLSLSHRYYTKNTISLRNHIFSHMIFGLYQRVILYPLAQITMVNLNYTLCPPVTDPFEASVGKWYYLVSDAYIFIGGEIFHNIIKILIG